MYRILYKYVFFFIVKYGKTRKAARWLPARLETKSPEQALYHQYYMNIMIRTLLH